MSGEDYRLLTLEDLLVTQSYIKKIYGKKNNTIDKLITSKSEIFTKYKLWIYRFSY